MFLLKNTIDKNVAITVRSIYMEQFTMSLCQPLLQTWFISMVSSWCSYHPK